MGMVWPRACLGGQGVRAAGLVLLLLLALAVMAPVALAYDLQQSGVSPDAYRRHLKTGARLAVRSTVFVRHKPVIFAKYLETHLLTQRRQPIGNIAVESSPIRFWGKGAVGSEFA
jgi:hypothetical protein